MRQREGSLTISTDPPKKTFFPSLTPGRAQGEDKGDTARADTQAPCPKAALPRSATARPRRDPANAELPIPQPFGTTSDSATQC